MSVDRTYEEALIEQVRPAFVRSDTEWLLEEVAVLQTIVEAGGDLARLTFNLALHADVCRLLWIPQNQHLAASEAAACQGYAYAAKAVATALDTLGP